MFQNKTDGVFINAGYEISLHNSIKVVSDNFLATNKITLNFKQTFKINSEDFKKKYRHDPIIINIFQGANTNSRKFKES